MRRLYGTCSSQIQCTGGVVYSRQAEERHTSNERETRSGTCEFLNQISREGRGSTTGNSRSEKLQTFALHCSFASTRWWSRRECGVLARNIGNSLARVGRPASSKDQNLSEGSTITSLII